MSKLKIFGTAVRINPLVLINLAALWAITTWLEGRWHPEWGFWLSLGVGFSALLKLLLADFGHAVAHIFSARKAGAPMDTLYISAGMPRTLYRNNEVAPGVHQMRSLGGPIFNLVMALLSLVVRLLATPGSVIADIASWSLIGNGLLFVGALLPLPMIDGGVLLKWELVKRGRSVAEADRMVVRIAWVTGFVIALAVTGVILVRRG